MEEELRWAAQLVNELISVATLQENAATRDVRHAALERFQQFALPAAILDAGGVRFANVTWGQQFRAQMPSWAATSFQIVRETNAPVHLEINTGEETGCVVARLVPARTPGDDAVLVVCSDMTDASIARQMMLAMEVVVWSGRVDAPHIADYCNARARDVLGFADLRNWQSLFDPASVSAWSAALDDAIHKRGSPRIELPMRAASGGAQLLARVVTGPDHKRWFTMAVDQPIRDEAERSELLERLRMAQAAAEQAHRIKDQVLAAVSHELRAPITTMMLWERVLRDPGADQTSRLQALDAIHQSAVAQSKIVADLLDMSRAISGKLHVDFRSVDMSKLIGSAVEAMLPSALAKRISLVYEGGGAIGEIQGDVARLRQVIDNLLSNAIKFTGPGGQVTVRIQRKRPVLIVEVEDNGRGIAPEALGRIFEPFRQAEDAISRREGGLGLGLAIAKQIVELHHGTLTARSEGPNRGTCLTLSLPLAGHRRSPSPPVGVTNARALAALRVLIIDDDERVRNALALLLDRAGAAVDSAESAKAARAKLAVRTPDVILCDIAMPDEDGYQFIRSLRETGNRIPAIALTAYASRADAERALSSGFDMHVAKPVDFERLVASVAQLVRGHAQHRI